MGGREDVNDFCCSYLYWPVYKGVKIAAKKVVKWTL